MNTLILDDSTTFRVSIKAMLAGKSEVYAVEKPSIAFKILKSEKIDVLLCDYLLPEMTGLEVLSIVKAEYPDVEVIMISSSGDMDTVINALRKGAIDFIKKPFTSAELWVSLERTRKYAELQADLHKTKKKNKLLKEQVNQEFGVDIIGESNAIREIKQQMELVAQTPDTSVLILGDSGTGKELIARGIHNKSARKEELFGAVNMSAIPESLFESEFFGHKKGSFTGAIADKAGWFESAHKGTLFFDEVGEMTMNLQVKLLRVLEDRRFVKVGGQKEQVFNVRIIAATNKSVDELTDGKDFRLDLFHRLGTFIIHVPPLHERPEDIPLITDHFICLVSKRMGKASPKVNQSVYKLLQGYDFPGNIRELRNMVERAIILCNNRELDAAHFNLLNVQKELPSEQPNTNYGTFDLNQIERQVIQEALKKVDYNKAEAARLLNLEWNALYRRIKKHNIELPSEVSKA